MQRGRVCRIAVDDLLIKTFRVCQAPRAVAIDCKSKDGLVILFFHRTLPWKDGKESTLSRPAVQQWSTASAGKHFRSIVDSEPIPAFGDSIVMEATHVKVSRTETPPRAAPGREALQADLARARMLAKWMDAQFSVGGIRFGFDAIFGLLPGVGDTVSAAIALYPIWIARRHGLGRAVQARMAFNVLMDWVPGMIPLVGDAFDVFYKANLKNLELLERAAEKQLHRRS